MTVGGLSRNPVDVSLKHLMYVALFCVEFACFPPPPFAVVYSRMVDVLYTELDIPLSYTLGVVLAFVS